MATWRSQSSRLRKLREVTHETYRETHLQRFLHGLKAAEVLPLEVDSAVLAGRIVADLKRTGQPIGSYDPLIAAIAIHHNRTLVTGNARHYQRIIDVGYALKLDDWREAAS